MKNKIIFTDENIQSLFGHEAAEDETLDRLTQYYFKNEIYDRICADLPIRILVGHKGIGKSALFKVAMSEDPEKGNLPILIRPDDIQEIAKTTTDFLQIIRDWKIGLNKIIADKVLGSLGVADDNWKAKVVGSGTNLMSSLIETVSVLKNNVNIDPIKRKMIDSLKKSRKVNVYIDDLDRGWLSRNEDINRISALLNAVRDICNDNPGVKFKISLRSDVYYLVRTSDESTDKIEGSVVWYLWDNHEILIMLIKRIETFLKKEVDDDRLRSLKQFQLASYLNSVMEPIFTGNGKWENAPIYRVLMSLIRNRPRDLVKLCTLAAQQAKLNKHDLINTQDFKEIFEKYSGDRIQDTVNEFRSELPEIKKLILGMKPTKKELKAVDSYVFKSPELLSKIHKIMEREKFRFANGNTATAKQLAQFLYKINFLTARKNLSNGKISRKDFEKNRYLSEDFVDFGYDWEIHPAYRWALQPDTIDSIYYNLDLSNDD